MAGSSERILNDMVQIFVQCDSDIMLARRIKRDVAERGRSVEGVLDQCVPLPSLTNTRH